MTNTPSQLTCAAAMPRHSEREDVAAAAERILPAVYGMFDAARMRCALKLVRCFGSTCSRRGVVGVEYLPQGSSDELAVATLYAVKSGSCGAECTAIVPNTAHRSGGDAVTVDQELLQVWSVVESREFGAEEGEVGLFVAAPHVDAFCNVLEEKLRSGCSTAEAFAHCGAAVIHARGLRHVQLVQRSKDATHLAEVPLSVIFCTDCHTKMLGGRCPCCDSVNASHEQHLASWRAKANLTSARAIDSIVLSSCPFWTFSRVDCEGLLHALDPSLAVALSPDAAQEWASFVLARVHGFSAKTASRAVAEVVASMSLRGLRLT